MILLGGVLNAERLLAGHIDGKPITKVAVGTGSNAVSENDTFLTNEFVKPVATVDYLTGGFVQFNVTLDASDPSMIIQEIGLKNADDVLCYRKVIPPVNKITGTTHAFSYKIKVQ